MHREQSVSSTSSVASFPSSLPSSVISDDSLPPAPTKPVITRRRLSSTQAAALNKMFQAKSHPLKEERKALAAEIGMDLKAVTIWFQNKRQITKRNSLSSKENVPPSTYEQNARSSKSKTARAQIRTPLRATISLDRVAERLQRPSQNNVQYLLTPRRPSRPPLSAGSKLELWKRMPSSPVVPPSPPAADSARFGILPSRSRTMRSLEWACAKARINPKKDEDVEPTDMSNLPPAREVPGADVSDSTDTDVDEAITPNSSVSYSAANGPLINAFRDAKEDRNSDSTKANNVHSSEVEAAMVLLGFKSQR